jgi:predicted PurR-regulated permease PerM
MIISVFQCIKLIKINTIEDLGTSWYFMLGLICFFLLGYIAFLFLQSNNSNIPISSLLICFILFFGAIFVIGVLSISYQLIKKLTQKTVELNKMNASLSENSNTLASKQEELIKMQGLLKQKNEELNKTLEDFYTIRIGMQKDMEKGKLEEENKMIKERLEKLK